MSRVSVTTNGMFIIDDIYTQKGAVHRNIPGGGGMFAMLGGCVVALNQRQASGLKWIIDCGNDFPTTLREIIKAWGSGAVFREDGSRSTTKGWNFYHDNDYREFKYLTPKKQIRVDDWCTVFGKEQLQQIKCLHLLCSSTRCRGIIEKLTTLGCKNNTYVWEPIPDMCNRDYFEEIQKIVQMDNGATVIFSPNAEEGARIFDDSEPLTLHDCLAYIQKFDTFIGDQNICVLRCGKLGSVSLGKRNGITGKREVVHLPAYHANTPEKVIDPTGGGNSFLGGFCVGYTLTGDLHIANICGNIAAGCIIEQIGIPKFEPMERKWNGLCFRQRLEYYIKTNQLKYNIDNIFDRLKN